MNVFEQQQHHQHHRHSMSQDSNDSTASLSHVIPPPPTYSRLPPDGHEFPPDYKEVSFNVKFAMRCLFRENVICVIVMCPIQIFVSCPVHQPIVEPKIVSQFHGQFGKAATAFSNFGRRQKGQLRFPPTRRKKHQERQSENRLILQRQLQQQRQESPPPSKLRRRQSHLQRPFGVHQ